MAKKIILTSEITEEYPFYLYTHIRKDTNKVFYVGIGGGDKKEFIQRYMRATSHKQRNPHWNNVVSITDYDIRIVLHSDSWKNIQEKEIEFISLYGRRDLGTGTLVNLTCGGEGVIGRIITENSRIKMSASAKGKSKPPFTIEHKNKIKEAKEKMVYTDEHRKNMSISAKGKPWSTKRREAQKLRNI